MFCYELCGDHRQLRVHAHSFHTRLSSELDLLSDVFPAQRRHRALAVPAGAQARRAPAWRLALRLPPPPCEVGKPGALHRLRARSAPHRAAAIAAKLRASRGARTQRRGVRSEEHTSGTTITNAQLVCRVLLEKKN